MRHHALLTLLSSGMLLPALPVFAGELSPFDPYWYAGASLAQSRYSGADNGSSSHNGLNAIVDGVHLGYQFNRYFGTEVEYQFLGNAGNVAVPGQLNGEFQQGVVSAHLGFPVTNDLYPYVKIGGAGWFGDVNITNQANAISVKGLSGVLGAGIGYNVFDNFELRLEYQNTNRIGNYDIHYADHQRIALGLTWRFGYTQTRTIIVEKPVIQEVIKEVIVEQIREVETVREIEKVIISDTNAKGALFAVNSSILSSTESIMPSVLLMKQYPSTTAIISGYTDSSGSAKYNQWLSERRAKRVADYFVEQGIDAARVSFVGEGEKTPIADNSTAKGRATNRRVEIAIDTPK
ncbi:OmpA family protein [Aliivibrio salmonicida]|uniref:OmpA family protein n=1 Tax=Aliivibrio salmonicida TaxID=40269 RepID=UPI00406C9603